MGYSEVLCNICGVSFNIGRIRRADEPRNAAWSTHTRKFFVASDGWKRECEEGDGCQFTFREASDGTGNYVLDEYGRRTLVSDAKTQERVDGSFYHSAEPDNDLGEEDADYVYQSDSDEEVLEYDEDEMVVDPMLIDFDITSSSGDMDPAGAAAAAADAAAAAMSISGQETDEQVDDDKWIREFWARTFIPEEHTFYRVETHNDADQVRHFVFDEIDLLKQNEDKQDDVFPLFLPADGEYALECGSEVSNTANQEGDDEPNNLEARKLGFHDDDKRKAEHIAGPGCKNTDGYSGHEISAKEMEFCSTLQCFVRKPPSGAQWLVAEPDDEDFERDGDYFLSGLSDHMPSRDMDYPWFHPPRHGCERANAENHYSFYRGDGEYFAMPFHPYCLEIYKRASGLIRGKVDIQGLTSWWEYRGATDYAGSLIDTESKTCNSQCWEHKKGTEYLVANPLHSDNLSEIMQSVVIPEGEAFNHQDGAFELLSTEQQGTRLSSTDPFAVLPHELRMNVLSYTSSKDIASLRLASRSFQQLPISFFHSLIMREIPWLWEAWSLPEHRPLQQQPFAFWATTTRRELESTAEIFRRKRRLLDKYTNIVGQEYPELKERLGDVRRAYTEQVADEERASRTPTQPFGLPFSRTNWFKLYTLITRHWSSLKGLQNRRRIWRDCEVIVNDIRELRETDQIPVRDLEGMVRRFEEKRRTLRATAR